MEAQDRERHPWGQSRTAHRYGWVEPLWKEREAAEQGPWKEKGVSLKQKTGGYKRTEKEDSLEAQGSQAASCIWVPLMPLASGAAQGCFGNANYIEWVGELQINHFVS